MTSSPPTLYLLCHGATPALRAAAFAGAADVLEAPARRRVQALAPTLPRYRRTLVAPNAAAAETATLIGHGYAAPTPALAGYDAGSWAGLDAGQLAQTQGPAFSRWMQDPAVAPPGGESRLAFQSRIGGWLDGWNAPGSTLAIASPFVLRAALLHALAAPAASFFAVDILPLTLLKLTGAGRRSPSGWAVAALIPPPGLGALRTQARTPRAARPA
ncbi:histidine phosphatase family protein [Radicibacter daui]|uniref:histidine phosphatase family protein n=1 Tax=Radicibacter daui TaxID=3064829 RepID=UPI004046DD39